MVLQSARRHSRRIVVALALIPEAIGFSVIAGVDPKVGLYASFAIACVSAFVGGRPGTISAATAATAVVMVSLVRDYGLQYLFALRRLTATHISRPAFSSLQSLLEDPAHTLAAPCVRLVSDRSSRAGFRPQPAVWVESDKRFDPRHKRDRLYIAYADYIIMSSD